MTRSMTAYASRTGMHGATTWVWDMRGVNARGLDLRLRLPDGVEGLEATLRTALKKALVRGNVTVGLRLTRDDTALPLALDQAQLDRVLEALEAVQERALSLGMTLAQPTAADVLAQRGVIASQAGEDHSDALVAALHADVDGLIADFLAMRDAEGAALNTILSAQIDEIARLTQTAAGQAEARRPLAAQAMKDALARIGDDIEVDPGRIAQELALIATKQDVTEELDRLAAHVAAAREMLADSGATGRKLDFLAQEFNREANTLCAKSQNAELTKTGLELKAVVDQFREQVQNVE